MSWDWTHALAAVLSVLSLLSIASASINARTAVSDARTVDALRACLMEATVGVLAAIVFAALAGGIL